MSHPISPETSQTAELILAINPGSTSTKIALFAGEKPLLETSVDHSGSEGQTQSLEQELQSRFAALRQALAGHDLSALKAIVARGGLLKPLASAGAYLVDDNMLKDLSGGRHFSSLGAIMAHRLAEELGLKAYVVDPIIVDEMEPLARLSGAPDFPRYCIFHVLNQKSVARLCAQKMGRLYEDLRLVVAHLGGGISVGAHRYGRVIDVTNALSGEGSFSPERCGALPTTDIINACFSGQYSKEELYALTNKRGGLTAYLGTSDLRQAEARVSQGDAEAYLVLEAMAYQVSKDIGAMVTVLQSRVDAIILTGGLAHSLRFVAAIKDRVSALAPVEVIAGEKEMQALAAGALRVLRGQQQALRYAPGGDYPRWA